MVRAAVCRTFGAPLTVEEITVAEPGPGQVKVAVKACAVCHSDIHFFDGEWGGRVPAVWGHEAAGVVQSLGDGVDDVAVGDHVVLSLIRSCGTCRQCRRGLQVACEGEFPSDAVTALVDAAGEPLRQGLATGAFAEEALVDRSQLVVVPSDMPLTSACLLGCGVITGVGAVLNTAAIEKGSDVVVIGCGGVGLNVVQGAAIAGAASVIAVDLADDKLEAAIEFGATATVRADGDVAARVRDLTDGRGADYVFVAVGAKPAMVQALTLIGQGGAAVLVGMPAAGVTVDLDPTALAAFNQRVLGSKMGTGRLATDIPMFVGLYEEGRLKLDELVSATYPLDEINEAIDSVKRGDARRNVIVFGPEPTP